MRAAPIDPPRRFRPSAGPFADSAIALSATVAQRTAMP
jgi:hypothetical protein